MSKLKIKGCCCIGLITKNVSKWIPYVCKVIEQYASFFTDYKVVFVDGYSTDATSLICKSWCKQDPIRRQFIVQSSTNLSRMPSICEARNTVLNHFRSQFGPECYLLLLDADSINSKLLDEESLTGFYNTFTTSIEWSAIFPNQKVKLYDTYALRDDTLNENYQIKHRNCNWSDGSMQRACRQYENPKSHPSGFYPVESYFGGAGIYKTNYLIDPSVHYDYKEIWTQPETRQQYSIDSCEHVILHQQIKKQGGQCYINCNWYNGEHL